MGAKFFDSTVIGSAEKALDFLGNLLEASTALERGRAEGGIHA